MRDGGASTHVPGLARRLQPDVAVRMLVARFDDLAGELERLGGVVLAPAVVGQRPRAAASARATAASHFQTRCSTHDFTDSSAAGSLAGSVPPACAMSGRPPPLPPTCCAT